MKELHVKYEELQKHIMEDTKPSEYLNQILKEKWFFSSYPFIMLVDLVKTEQSSKHHPEGNVWNHTMMVLDNAAERRDKSRNLRAFMWAALLHDLGKAPTTKLRNGRITSYDHDKVGEGMSINFLKCFIDDEEFIHEVSKLVRWHMQILFVDKNLPFADIKHMSMEVSIDEIALLGLCDRLGRGELTSEKIEEEKRNIELFVRKCEDYNTVLAGR